MKKILIYTFGLLLSAGSLFAATIERYAIYIGSNNGGQGKDKLLYAGSDALSFQKTMAEIGGIPESNSWILIDPTKDSVKEAIESVTATINYKKKTTGRSEFVFYYSGHSNEEALLLGNESFSYSDLKQAITDIPSDIHVVILDSCYSGNFIRTKGGQKKKPFLLDDSSVVKGHAYLSSSSEKESSQESDEIESSFFTNAVITGLRGAADTSGDNKVSLNELYTYAFNDTLSKTEDSNAGPQHPNYNITLVGSGDLILSDISNAESLVSITKEAYGKYIIRDGSGKLISEINKEKGIPITMALSAGSYSVFIIRDSYTKQGQFTLKPNQNYVISENDLQIIERKQNKLRGSLEDSGSGNVNNNNNNNTNENNINLNITINGQDVEVTSDNEKPASKKAKKPVKPSEEPVEATEDFEAAEESVEEVIKPKKLTKKAQKELEKQQRKAKRELERQQKLAKKELEKQEKAAKKELEKQKKEIKKELEEQKEITQELSDKLELVIDDELDLSKQSNLIFNRNLKKFVKPLKKRAFHLSFISQIDFVDKAIYKKKDYVTSFSLGILTAEDRNLNGLQMAPIYSKVDQYAIGTVLSGIIADVNYGNGFMASGIYNKANRFNGTQLSLVNTANQFKGFQCASVFNYADYFSGFQLSGAVNVATEVSGVQMAGIFNYAKKLSGFQIGLVNYAKESTGFSLGLINIIANGAHDLGVEFDNDHRCNIQYQSGSRSLFGTFGIGLDYMDSNDNFGFGSVNTAYAGLGHRFGGTVFYFDIEALWKFAFDSSWLSAESFWSAVEDDFENIFQNQIPALKMTMNLTFFDHFTLTGAFNVDVGVQGWNEKAFELFPRNNVWNLSFDDTDLSFYYSFSVGLKIR